MTHPASGEPTESNATVRQAKSNGLMALLLVGLCLLALILGLFNGFQKSTASSDQTVAASSKSSRIPGFLSKNKLALINLSGPIYMDAPQDGGLFSSETNAVTVRKALDQAANDDNIRGVLLHINSPGGTVAMSQELNAAVTRTSKKKPVVVSLGDMAASGGYYTACAADKIVTNAGTLTASIGVIISTLNFKHLMEEKLGVHAVTFKSGKFKDLLSPYRDTNPEEAKLMQDLIDDSYQDFLGAVLQGRTRHFSKQQAAEKARRVEMITAIADGRVVQGKEAVKVGLADEVGDLHRAYELLDQMAKERFNLKEGDKLPLQDVDRFPSVMDWLGISSSESGSLKAPKINTGAAQPYAQMLPLSLRYPNQPLWVLE